MPGDSKLGTVLRELRTARGLSIATVARQANCDESLVSYVESGRRQLQPWLADKLDLIYGTGSVVSSLACRGAGRGRTPQERPASGILGVEVLAEVFVVRLPQGGVVMPLSRRELFTALGVGVISGELQGKFERALDAIKFDSDLLQAFDDALSGFKQAGRMLPPIQIIDGMTGNVAVLDNVRRRATTNSDRRRCGTLLARYAESLSWFSEETGDLTGAMWWIDRASQWAQAAGWPGMTAYGFIRRSMLVNHFSGDGYRTVSQAREVLDIPQLSPRMRGLAAIEMAGGYALAGMKDESRRALDTAMNWLVQPVRDDDAMLGQRSVLADDLFVVYQTECEVYLGYGTHVIPVLEPRMEALNRQSIRTATITRAKLARAYANAGQPADACRVAWETLDSIEEIGSHWARSELRRAVPVLNRWPGRSDVQEVINRLNP